MKETLCTMIGILGSIIASLFGGWDSAFITLLIFMAIDFATGLIVAAMGNSDKSESGKQNSNSCWKGLAKKVCVLMLLVVAVRLDILLGTTYVRDAVCIGFCCNELISIIENTGLMGVNYPQTLKDAIELLQGKSK
jgi:toxin secretion/phage lysis holin